MTLIIIVIDFLFNKLKLLYFFVEKYEIFYIIEEKKFKSYLLQKTKISKLIGSNSPRLHNVFFVYRAVALNCTLSYYILLFLSFTFAAVLSYNHYNTTTPPPIRVDHFRLIQDFFRNFGKTLENFSTDLFIPAFSIKKSVFAKMFHPNWSKIHK